MKVVFLFSKLIVVSEFKGTLGEAVDLPALARLHKQARALREAAAVAMETRNIQMSSSTVIPAPTFRSRSRE